MDFQVEVTIHLDYFQDKPEVFQILRSHDFVTLHQCRNKLRVKGQFLGLKSVKARLEQLLEAQNLPPHPPASAGAVPRNHHGSTSATGGTRSAAGSSTSTSPLSDSPHWRPTGPARPDQPGSVSHRRETLLVEGDVFRYAGRVRRQDLARIIDRHKVWLRASEVGESFRISLEGEDATEAAGELQKLLSRLHTSLRTQDVPRQDMGPKGHAVLRRIREHRSLYSSVLVCEMNDRLHLIGPSTESYELKQALLGRPARTGSTSDEGSRRRNADAEPPPGRAARQPPPEGGAAAEPPWRSRDEKLEGAGPGPGERGTQSASASAENRAAADRRGPVMEPDEMERASWV